MSYSATFKFQFTKRGVQPTTSATVRVKQKSDALLQAEIVKKARQLGGSDPIILDIKWR